MPANEEFIEVLRLAERLPCEVCGEPATHFRRDEIPVLVEPQAIERYEPGPLKGRCDQHNPEDSP